MPKRKCCIETRKSTFRTNTVHPFPKSEKLKKKWQKTFAYSYPELAKVKETDYKNLGICNEHFMLDHTRNGRRKYNAIPLLITPKEVSVGVPITSYGGMLNACDTLSDEETESKPSPTIRINETKTAAAVAAPAPAAVKSDMKAVCRLCLVTNVKMFSLESGPVKEHFQYFASCFDEIESSLSKKFPKSVCYMCANSLMKCFDFGNKCAKAQSVLMDIFLMCSQINANLIKEHKSSILIPQHNLSVDTLPSLKINIPSSHENKVLKTFFNLSNEDLKPSDSLDNVLKSEYADDVAKIENVENVEENDEQMSIEYLDPDTLDNEVLVKFETTKQKDARQTVRKQDINIFPCVSAEKTYVPRKCGMNNSKLMDAESEDSEDVEFVDVTKVPREQTKDTPNSQSNIARAPVEITEEIDAPQPVYKQTISFSTFLSAEKTFVARTSEINQPKLVDTEDEDSDDVLFVDVTKATQEPVKNTPNLSQSQIKILKKSVYKTHGDVEIKTMFYEGADITVIMENAQGKQVQLKLSRTNNLQEVEGGARKKAGTQPVFFQPENEVTFAKECWNVELLSREQYNAIRQSRKQLPQYCQAKFKCDICYRGFQTNKRLEIHNRRHDPGVNRLLCSVCYIYLDNAYELREHKKSHRTQFYCKMCPVLCQSLKDATDHQLAHAIFHCPKCKEEFRIPADYTKHKHKDDSNKGGFTKPNPKPIIKYPIADVVVKPPQPPKIVPKWSATCCEKTFLHKPAYRRHYSLNHPDLNCPLNEGAIVCELCGMLVDSQALMVRHLDEHANPICLFECEYCHKMFRLQQYLDRHILIHKKEKLFSCTKCPMIFRKNGSLKNHLLKDHKRKTEGMICELCGKNISKLHNLKTHMLYKHRGIKSTKAILERK